MATVIRTATELQAMSADLDGDYELGCDFDASETAAWNGGLGFAPVGNSTTEFTGTFDGKGFTVTGLTINRPATDGVALFGETEAATIQNVTLASASIIGRDEAAPLIGQAEAGTQVTNCHASGTVSGRYNAGGLIGNLSDASAVLRSSHSDVVVTGSATDAGGLFGGCQGQVYDCYATGAVTGYDYVGGLGSLYVSGHASCCYATGAVEATNDYAGGLFGYCGESSVADCYARGAVTGSGVASDGVGGLAGDVYDADFARCYSTGAVSGVTNVGGFVGYIAGGDPSTFTGCCWDTTTSGSASASGGGALTGVTGYETASLQDANVVQSEGFAIGRDWNLIGACNAGYPCLIGVNACCSLRVTPADITVSKTKPSLELIRNLEMQCDGRFYIAKDGKATYESRFSRHG